MTPKEMFEKELENAKRQKEIIDANYTIQSDAIDKRIDWLTAKIESLGE